MRAVPPSAESERRCDDAQRGLRDVIPALQAVTRSRNSTLERRRGGSAVAAVVLVGIAGVHVAWGRGSSFPFATVEEMHDAVIGRPVSPSPASCYAVAGLLVAAAAATAGVPSRGSRLRRLAAVGTATVLAVRAAAGFSGRTDLLVPGSASPRFRRLDRRVYSPLCLALAAGAAMSLSE